MQGYQAVEWSKSRSWASDRFVRSVEILSGFLELCLEGVHWNHPGETEVRKLYLQWGGCIEPWLAVDSSFAWRIPSLHAGVRASALFEEVSQRMLYYSAKIPRLLVILSGLLQPKGSMALFGPALDKVELGHGAPMQRRVVATRPEIRPPGRPQLHSCNGGLGYASVIEPSRAPGVRTLVGAAQCRLQNLFTHVLPRPGMKFQAQNLCIQDRSSCEFGWFFLLVSSEMRELLFAS